MIKIPAGSVSADKMMIINPDGSVTYEPNVRYQQPTIIRRTYQKPVKPKYRYMIEQVSRNETVHTSDSYVNVLRKGNRTDAVNGVGNGALVNVRYAMRVIGSFRVRCCALFYSFSSGYCYCPVS